MNSDPRIPAIILHTVIGRKIIETYLTDLLFVFPDYWQGGGLRQRAEDLMLQVVAELVEGELL